MTSSPSRPVQTYCLSLSAPFDQIAQFADHLAQLYDEDPPAISTHEIKDRELWQLSAYYQAEPDLPLIEKALATITSPVPAIDVSLLENTDWVSLVQRQLSPVTAGRFFIHGSHDRSRAGQRAGEIEVDAGQAFGTAHHGTTKGCLLALDHLFKARKFHNILDLGTGTGLLAIAAARVHKQKVLASDIDPISIEVANQNASLNRVSPLIGAIEADGLHHKLIARSGPFDLLIANILAAPLREMAPDIKRALSQNGRLVLSGLLQSQSRSIEACYKQRGFRIVKRIPLDEWMTLILYRC